MCNEFTKIFIPNSFHRFYPGLWNSAKKPMLLLLLPLSVCLSKCLTLENISSDTVSSKNTHCPDIYPHLHSHTYKTHPHVRKKYSKGNNMFSNFVCMKCCKTVFKKFSMNAQSSVDSLGFLISSGFCVILHNVKIISHKRCVKCWMKKQQQRQL